MNLNSGASEARSLGPSRNQLYSALNSQTRVLGTELRSPAVAPHLLNPRETFLHESPDSKKYVLGTPVISALGDGDRRIKVSLSERGSSNTAQTTQDPLIEKRESKQNTNQDSHDQSDENFLNKYQKSSIIQTAV